jgi:hypothetical protein
MNKRSATYRHWQARLKKLDDYAMNPLVRYTVTQYAEMLECGKTTVCLALAQRYTKAEFVRKIEAYLDGK